jgi:predicted RNA-binding protein
MLTNEQIATLRADGHITEQEVAFVEGDLVVAKDVVTEAKRIIGKTNELNVVSESTDKRRVLKG